VISERQVFEALPRSGFLRSYVEWAGRWLESNVAFHVSGALALLAQSVSPGLAFPGITPLRANFYALLVGPSSASGKTRSIDAAKSVLERAMPKSIMATPGSPQACIDALNGTPQILLYPEFGSFLQNTESGVLAPLRMTLTDLYDCGVAGRDLVKSRQRPKQKDPEQNPRLSVFGGVTPGLLEAYTTEIDWSEGFLARFFTMYASSDRQLPYARFEGSEGTAERDRLADLLLSYSKAADPFTGDDPKPCGGFTLGAASRWDAWCVELKKAALKGDNAVRAAIHRAHGHALKVALLLSWDFGTARSGAPWNVDLDTLEPALAFTQLHIESVEEIAAGLASDRDMRDERRLYRAIEDTPIEFGEAILKARLTKKRGYEMIESLLEKKMVVRLTETDMTAPIRYMRKRLSNVIPFPMKRAEGDPSDPFFD
jgi:uncharacterized protein DUF3987